MEQQLVLKGNIIDTIRPGELRCVEQGYLVISDGQVQGVFAVLPPRYSEWPVLDQGDQLIIPGLVDLHLHAPQYAFRGSGMSLPLLPWLNTFAFPEEARYSDIGYAEQAYIRFVNDLRASFTTRAAVFGTRHGAASTLLMRLLRESGLGAYVGRVSMDQNAPKELVEGARAADNEEAWLIAQLAQATGRVRPIITPRFVLSCSGPLMAELGKFAARYRLPVQTHLSENVDEVAAVAEMYPDASCYADVYRQFGLLNEGTVLAHCVQCDYVELNLLRESGAYVAHCPQSNTNLGSGIAPVRSMLELGVRVGLGTDMAGGAAISMFRAIEDAIAVSKLRQALLGDAQPLNLAEAFYLATMGGGGFFGRVGCFEPGYAADILVINDSSLERAGRSLEIRLERAVYLLDPRAISAKFVDGERLF